MIQGKIAVKAARLGSFVAMVVRAAAVPRRARLVLENLLQLGLASLVSCSVACVCKAYPTLLDRGLPRRITLLQ